MPTSLKSSESLGGEKKTALVFLSMAIIGYFIKYLFGMFLTYHMSPKLYGDFSIAFRVLTMCAAVSLFGTHEVAQKYLASYSHKNKHKAIEQYLGWNFKVLKRTFSTVFIIAILLVIIMFILHHYNIRDIHKYHLAVYMLWLAPFSSLVLLLASFLSIAKRPFLSYFFSAIAQYLFATIFFVIAIYYFSFTMTKLSITTTLMIVFLVLFVIEVIIMRVRNAFSINPLKVQKQYKKNNPEWLRTSYKYALSNFSQTVLLAIDLIIVETVSPFETDVGHYSIAILVATFIWVVPMGLYNSFRSDISLLVDSAKGKKQLQNSFDKINKIIIPTVFVATALVIIFSNNILGHFGASYVLARPALIVLSCGYAFAAFAVSNSVLLAYAGCEKHLLFLVFAEMITLIIFAIPMTYAYGIVGTAIATAVVLFLKTIAGSILVRKKLKFRAVLL